VTTDSERRSAILVVEDVEETRFGIERLLAASGYQVSTARDEEEEVLKTGLHHPDLILISLDLSPTRVVAIVKRMRERAGLGEEVPVVVFCVAYLDEGRKWRPDTTST
jgi:CheY-like chemotaxis protein